MFLKPNKQKQNQRSQRLTWLTSLQPISSQFKAKTPINSLMLNPSLQSKYKILKMRRHSNFISISKQTAETEMMNTINAKKIQIYQNRDKIKNKNCKSENNHYYDKNVLQQSNFDRLKQQARKLQDDSLFYSLYRIKQPGLKLTKSIQQSNEQNINIFELQPLKKSKKSNMRKIIRGRPEIKKLLKQNRDKIQKLKITHHTDCILSQNLSIKSPHKNGQQLAEIKLQYRNNYVLHTIV